MPFPFSHLSYGPVDFSYTTLDNFYVTSVTAGTPRNDLTGFFGLTFITRVNPVVVTQLGRMKIAGNINTHTVKLVNDLTGVDVPGGSVLIDLSLGTAGFFQYMPLSAPVTLRPGVAYRVVSSETAAGDFWFDSDAIITHSEIGLTPIADATFISVPATSTLVIPANASRTGLVITNVSLNVISISFGASPAILNNGITLTPGDSFIMDSRSFSTARVNMLAAIAASRVSVQEFI